MNSHDFQTCTLADLSNATGGNRIIRPEGGEPYMVDDNGVAVPGGVGGAPYTVNKRNPLIRFGKPDHPTPLPTPYIDRKPPFLHFT